MLKIILFSFQYASDMDCFVLLMEKFRDMYSHYPKYSVTVAGYGSYNNNLYCEEHGIEKYMKFTMYDKESVDPRYRENPFRGVNIKQAQTVTLCVRIGRDLTSSMTSMYVATSMDGLRKSMNAKAAMGVS